MKKVRVNRIAFAALHRKIIETCYPDSEKRKLFEESTETEFYGLDNPPQKKSINYIMREHLSESINGRTLYNLKLLFNEGIEELEISSRYLNVYIAFIGLKREGLGELIDKYMKIDPSFPPQKIRPQKTNHDVLSVRPLQEADKRVIKGEMENLGNLANSKWWVYFYEYEHDPDNKRNLIRLVLSFHRGLEGFYLVDLINVGAPYIDFQGRIKSISDGMLILDLKARNRQMFLLVNLEDSGLKEIYLGIYLKHNSANKICSGSVILQRIKDEIKEPMAKVFDRSIEEIKEVPKAIAQFFEDKKYAFIKTPISYTLSGLDRWLLRKMDRRNELKDIDLFVSATLISMKEKKEQTLSEKKKIEATIIEFLFTDCNIELTPKQLEKLTIKISEAQDGTSSDAFPNTGTFSDLTIFDEAIRKVVNKLGEEIPEMEVEKIHYFFKEYGFLTQDPKSLLERDLRLLKRSKGFLLICPYNRIFSSCWVMIGWALVLEIPTFIVYRDDEDLPYILRGANTLKDVYMLKLKHDNLESIVNWFLNNQFGPKYFQ